MDNEQLSAEAVKAREMAYAPYSGFKVGAALLTRSGRVYTGCNIENAAYTPTVCAERTVFFKAVSEGERSFEAIAVAGWRDGAPMKAYPCGVCRQVMMEFTDPQTFKVIVTDGIGASEACALGDLLPKGFGPSSLNESNMTK